MLRRTFPKPLNAARVFLSHSWEDIHYTDYLYTYLSQYFSVYYDASNMLVGDYKIPEDEIFDSDVFLFTASKHSFGRSSNALKELNYARNLGSNHQPLIAIVQLDDFDIPPQYTASRYLSFRWHKRRQDTNQIIAEISEQLFQTGGLDIVRTHAGPLIVGGERSDVILEHLTSPYYHDRGLYMLNAPYKAFEMNNLVHVINKQDNGTQRQIADEFLRIFVEKYKEHYFSPARQNSIILLAKTHIYDDEALLTDIKRRIPDYNEPFLYRGFHIALGLMGGHEEVRDYALSLLTERKCSKKWNMQQKINYWFHVAYYGGIYPAVYQLRESIIHLAPVELLPLNVYTLGDLSDEAKDIRLIECQRDALTEQCDVPEAIISDTVKRIKLRRAALFT